MQEKEKEGCWFMTYYQEPVRVMSQIYYSSVLLIRLLGVGERGEGGRLGGGLSSNSQDSYFSHILGNDYHIIIIIIYDYRRFDAQCLCTDTAAACVSE
jgi:hypothetical protein